MKLQVIALPKKNIFLFLFILNYAFFNAQNYATDQINKELLENADAVIRLDETQINIQSINKIQNKEKLVVTVLNKGGDDFARLSFDYDSEVKINKVSVFIYDKSGKKIKTIKKSDFMDRSAMPDYSMFIDNRMITYEYTPVFYPYTIEYEIESESKNTAFIQPYFPVKDYNTSVEKSSFSVTNTSNINLRKKTYTSDLFTIEEKKIPNGSLFSSTNIEALQKEPYSPTLKNLVPKIYLSLEKFTLSGKEGNLENWDSFGKWMYDNLIKPSNNLPVQTKQQIIKMTEGKSQEEKIKILYDFLQEKTRYILVAIGLGGWKPSSANDVFSKGYGDCKGLSNLMRSMLEEVDIPSYYTVINSDKNIENFDKDFPRFGGNHVILNVPLKDKTIWLENTSQKIGFNQLSSETANRNALAITPEGGKIIETKVYDEKNTTEQIKIEVTLSEEGSATLKINNLYNGLYYSNLLGLADLQSNVQQKIIQERYDNLVIGNLNILEIKNNKDNGTFIENFSINAAKFSSKLGNEMFFYAVPVERIQSTTLKDENRKFPLEISVGYTDSLTTSFILPAGYKAENLPPNIEQTSEFGTYTLTFAQEQNKILVTRTLSIKKGNYPKEKFNNYINFLRFISKFDITKITITKK